MKLGDEGMIVLYDGKGLQIREVTDEVAKLERKLDAAQKTIDFAEVVAKRLEIDIVDVKSELQQAKAELEQWRAENLDGDNPSTRPMTRLEHRWMDEKKEWTAQLVTAQDQLEQSRQREARLQAELGLKNAGQCDCDECVEQALKEK